jgi:hypothetical protein
MLNNFPLEHGPARENLILESVKNGSAKYNLTKITWSEKGHSIDFFVFEDALKIENVRVNVTAETQQKIADMLDCILPTAKIMDIMWDKCIQKLTPNPRLITSSTIAMIDHSGKIDAEMDKKGYKEGFVFPVGKSWIIDNWLVTRADRAINYGWHFSGDNCKGIKGEQCASGIKNPVNGKIYRVIQGRGSCHNAGKNGSGHSDYSQICILVSKKCIIDGIEKSIEEVLQDPNLAYLINHDGVLKILRQPGVEKQPVLVSDKDFYSTIPPVELKSIPVSIVSSDSFVKKEESKIDSTPISINKESKNLFTLILDIVLKLLGKG